MTNNISKQCLVNALLSRTRGASINNQRQASFAAIEVCPGIAVQKSSALLPNDYA
jgi:hypothetical protein